jgi:hypothetical protein
MNLQAKARHNHNVRCHLRHIKTSRWYEILGFHGGDVSSRGPLGCDAVWCYGRSSMLPPSLPWRLKQYRPLVFQVEVFWVVTPCSIAVENPYCLHLHPEDGGSMDLWIVGILPQHYTASQPRKPRLEVTGTFRWVIYLYLRDYSAFQITRTSYIGMVIVFSAAVEEFTI